MPRSQQLALVLAQLTWYAELVRSPSFVSQVVAPSLNASIGTFMAYPHNALSFSLPAADLGFLELSGEGSTAEIQDWLYGQTVATEVGESGAITMLYIGLEDGRFLGFNHAEGDGVFKLRGTGDALARDVDWDPFALDDVSAACRAVQFDNAIDRRSGRPCRRHRECDVCLHNGCDSCEAKTDAPTDPTVQADCGAGAHTDAWHAMHRAHCIVDQTGAACCNGSVRAAYNMDATLARHTSHGALSSWSVYDHRYRDWYMQAKGRWEETGITASWSSIYSCHASGKYCITATGAASRLVRTDRSELVGVFGADYDLELLSSIIEHGMDGLAGTWAYLVERGSDKLIASSMGDSVYTLANSSTSGPIRESAQMLQDEGWPGGRDIDRKPGNIGWEAHTTIFEGNHGLDWLIVVGQNLNCLQSQIWNFGQCLDCPPGQAPAPNGQVCSKCRLQGEVPDKLGVCAPCPAGFHADAEQVNCVLCPAGKFSNDADLECLTCEDPRRMIPNDRRTDCECAPQHYNSTSKIWRCFDSEFWSDGGAVQRDSSSQCDECPPCAVCQGAEAAPQLKPGFRAVAVPSSTDDVRAFLCATTVATARIACLGGQTYHGVDANLSDDYGVVPCANGYDGELCQSCAQDFHRVDHLCVQCDGGSWWSSELWIALLLLAAIVLWKYWAKKCLAARLKTCLDQPVDWTDAPNTADEQRDSDAVENPVARDNVEALPRNGSAERRLRLSTNASVRSLAAAAVDPEKLLTVTFRSMFTPVRTLITYVQVTAQIGRVLQMQLPGYMQDFVNACKPFLNTWELFVSMDCAGYGGFYALWTAKVVALPVVCLLIIVGVFLFDTQWTKITPHELDVAQNAAKTRIFFTIFFLYPTICNALFSTFNCRHIAEDLSLLVEDDRILCESTAHQFFKQISTLLIGFFAVGVPVSTFYFLMKRRMKYDQNQQNYKKLIERVVNRLDTQTSNGSRAGPEEPEDREEGFSCSPCSITLPTRKYTITETKANILVREVKHGHDVAFLLSSYKPARHYWECLDMLRKFFLVGAVLFVPRGSAAQLLLAVLLSGFFLTWHVKQWPFKDTHDNIFRMFTEVHVFITFAVCLALRGSARDDSDAFQEMATAATFWSFILLVPCGFVVTVLWKLRVAQSLMRESPKDRERQAAERVLKGFGDDQDCAELKKMFEEIETQISEEEKDQQLTDDDRRILFWVREELELESKMDDQSTIKEARARLDLPDTSANTERNVSKDVQEIRDRIVERTHREDGVFLSHYQMYGADVMDLKGALVKAGIDKDRIWYDKDNDPSEKNMRLGVRDSRYFLLYLTEGVLERPFCRKEIRWCLMYKKEVVLLWKQEGSGSVASFSRFFADCNKDLNDDSHKGLVDILSPAAVPYYLSGDFHSASMSELLRKLGQEEDAEDTHFFGFEGTPPAVHIGYCRKKVSNARAVQNGLEALAPQLDNQVSLGLDRGTALSGKNISDRDIVIVYLTEGLFDDEKFVGDLRGLLKERQQAIEVATRLRPGLRVPKASSTQMPIIWVVESDMRHGWSNYQNSDWERRKDHGWQDALRHLQASIAENSVFFTQGWITAEMFEGVIPFYKDAAFKNKSLACILKEIGAKPMDEAELRRNGSFNGQQRNRARAVSIGEGSSELTRQTAHTH